MLKKKILVIDDEEGMGRMIKFGIESRGPYEIRYETDGTRALEVTRQFKPDLILMDIMMPGVEGSEAAAKIKSDPLFRNIPIIFLTATVTSDEVTDRGGSIGGQDFLAKPVDLEILFNRIQKCLK